MTRHGRAFAAALLVALSCRPAAAQERRPKPTTQLSLGLATQWDDNARFSAAGEETNGFTQSLLLGFGHSHPIARGFGFGVNGQGTYFRSNLDELTRFDYGGSANLVWAPSRGFNLRISQSAGSSLARDNADLLGAGIVYGVARVVRSASSVALGGNVSARVSWKLGADYTFNLFDTGLFDDRQATAQAQIARSFGRSSSLYLGVGGRQAFVRGTNLGYLQIGRVYNASAGFRSQGRRGLAIDLGAGVAYREQGKAFAAIGVASISKQLKRFGLAAQYSRNIENAYGLGLDRLVNNVTGSVSLSVWKVTASGGAVWTFGRILGENFEQRSLTPAGSLGFPIALGKDLSTSFSYGYQRSNLIAGRQRGSNRVSFGINWNHALGQRRSRR